MQGLDFSNYWCSNKSLQKKKKNAKFLCTCGLQVFTVPLEERKYKEMSEQHFGEKGEQAKICQEIMVKTGMFFFFFLKTITAIG